MISKIKQSQFNPDSRYILKAHCQNHALVGTKKNWSGPAADQNLPLATGWIILERHVKGNMRTSQGVVMGLHMTGTGMCQNRSKWTKMDQNGHHIMTEQVYQICPE